MFLCDWVYMARARAGESLNVNLFNLIYLYHPVAKDDSQKKKKKRRKMVFVQPG